MQKKIRKIISLPHEGDLVKFLDGESFMCGIFTRVGIETVLTLGDGRRGRVNIETLIMMIRMGALMPVAAIGDDHRVWQYVPWICTTRGMKEVDES